MVYLIIKYTDAGSFVLTGRDGFPMAFHDRMTASMITRGLQEAGMNAQVCEFDPACEVLNIPLDTFGLSTATVRHAAQRLAAVHGACDLAKVEGRGVAQ